jgi:DNA-binding ferritin-like protein
MKNFLEEIFWIEAQIQLNHWQETRGFHHEIYGKFHSEISEKFDELVETFIGGNNNVAPLVSDSLFVLTNNMAVDTLITQIKKFVGELHDAKEMQSHALQNVLDDILTLIDKYNYLLNRE